MCWSLLETVLLIWQVSSQLLTIKNNTALKTVVEMLLQAFIKVPTVESVRECCHQCSSLDFASFFIASAGKITITSFISYD